MQDAALRGPEGAMASSPWNADEETGEELF